MLRMRASTSGAPPGANGTIMRTGLVGYAWAGAWAGACAWDSAAANVSYRQATRRTLKISGCIALLLRGVRRRLAILEDHDLDRR
jgi:hypothetical protein